MITPKPGFHSYYLNTVVVTTTYENPYEDREDAEQEACTDKKEDTTDL